MRSDMTYEFISWSAFYRLCLRLHEKILASGYRPDTVISIARGGCVPGRVLADLFDVMDLRNFKIEHYHGPDKQAEALIRYPLTKSIEGRRILLVDDVSDTGDTFKVARAHLCKFGRPTDLRIAVLHHKRTSAIRPDYYAQRVLKWRWITYPWAVVEDMTILASRLHREQHFILPKGLESRIGDAVLSNLITRDTQCSTLSVTEAKAVAG
jgi:hypoxanthine phosphoribosyltransferase